MPDTLRIQKINRIQTVLKINIFLTDTLKLHKQYSLYKPDGWKMENGILLT